MNHTPTPLTIKKGAFVNIVCPRGAVCEMTAGYEETRLHDAEFIVQACNAHEELIAELKRVLMNVKAPHATDWETVAERITHTLTTIEKGE